MSANQVTEKKRDTPVCSALAPREGENVKEFDDLLSVQ